MRTKALPLLALLVPLGACEKTPETALAPLPELRGNAAAATPRVDGRVGTPDAARPPIFSYAEGTTPGMAATPAGTAASGPGEFSLDFADTDIREVAAQILGTMLRVNYTIDPNVRGSVTLRTARPIPRAELLPTLQALLAQNGAVLSQSGSLYRIGPAAGGAAGAGAQAAPGTGGVVVPLRFAAAEDLAKVLQPYVGQGGKVIPDPGRNALLVVAEGEARDSLLSLIQAFDTDILQGQSYALLPVSTGGVKEFATALQEAFRGQGGGSQGASLGGAVRVVPMERINSVLVVSAQRETITAARRIYDTLDKARRQNLRSWYVHYLQNGQANDLAYLLQQAFTPNNVTASPGNRPGGGARGGIQGTSGLGGGMGGGMGGGGAGGMGGGLGSGGAGGAGGTASGASTSGGASAAMTAPTAGGGAAASNPLLGGLDVLGVGGGGPAGQVDGMRIVPNESNNAVLIFATLSEYDTVKAMLRKVDIIPLQVRIDATIAEVTLNDNLKYGTQYFFKAGGINGVLSYATPPVTAANIAANAFPGFLLGGTTNGASAALTALQAVTEVRVLSSPQLLVLDNQSAKLQVGSLVPYLSQTAQGTIVPNAPIINSVNYQQTGVIMQITPRVNSGGLVTLDVAQEVSEVDNTAGQAAGTGINSPTFQNRNVISRVVVQDGQTIGLAGLIRDTASTGNDGIPLLKDIPWLGSLAGRQSNTRTRTELIVLITPHVMHNQRDAQMLTQDLREGLINAALVPQELQDTHPSGSPDPGKPARRAIRRPQ